MKKGKRYVATLTKFLQGQTQTDLVTGKRELIVINIDKTHYF